MASDNQTTPDLTISSGQGFLQEPDNHGCDPMIMPSI